MGRREERHEALTARLAAVRSARLALQQEARAFALDAAAPEKRAVASSVRELLRLSPEVAALGMQTGAVVERIANANDVAEKMTREVRRLDVVQSRMTRALAQSGELLTLRNALAGVRRALGQRQLAAAAGFLRELKAVERATELDAADKLRLDTAESDLKAAVEADWAGALRASDARVMHSVAPLFRDCGAGSAFEEVGFGMMLAYVEDRLEQQLSPMTYGTFSTKELLEHLATAFNAVAAVEQELGVLVTNSFRGVDGHGRLLTKLYGIGEKHAVRVLVAYMKQRELQQKMAATEQRVDPSGPAGTASAAMPNDDAPDDVAMMNERLNEIALVIQHTQTFERFMRSREVVQAPNETTAPQEIADESSLSSSFSRLPLSHESELGKTVQELAGFYCYFENDLLNRAARKAFQWEELHYSSSANAPAVSGDSTSVSTFPISSAVDEIFYVARNSGLRALATGHSDCAAGVLNMINTVLRDVLGDAMRGRVLNMAAFIKFESEASLANAGTQLRDQMTQQFAKFSKTMGPIPLGSSAPGAAASSSMTGNSTELRKECGPDVVMNSLEATTEYIGQIKEQFAQELDQVFADIPAHLRSSLDGLADAANELGQVLNASRKKLLKLLEPKISAALAPLLAPGSSKRAAVTYELTEAQFTFNEANDPFAVAFVAGLRALLGSFKDTLSPVNYRSVSELAAQTTAELIAKWMETRGARFNQLGALQFDKDLRVLTAFFNEQCDARDAFAELTQMAAVLVVDEPDDAADVFGRAVRGVRWKLSASRTKELLARRVEFADAALNQLVLQ